MSEKASAADGDDEDLSSLFSRIYNDGAKLLILKALSEAEGASLRENYYNNHHRGDDSRLKRLKEDALA
jgi:hypothetical protein